MSNERGFTLPELVAATVGLVVLFGIAALLLAPATYTNERLDAQRKLDVAAIVQAINRYTTDAGEQPPFIPAEMLVIGNSENEYDLCTVLTSEYIPALPLEPQKGVIVNEDGTAESAASVDCDDPDVVYRSGYGIVQNEDGNVSVGVTLTNGQQFAIKTQKQK